jgi:Ca-activated chloride channel family protein
MTFAEPDWLFCLLLIPVMLVLIWKADQRSRNRLQKLIAPRLLPQLTDRVSNGLRLLKRLLFVSALACFLIGMARPQFGFLDQQVTQRGRDIVLAIDTSKSMLTRDTVPDRLTRAKLAAQDILGAMNGDRFGLVAFAGTAQVEAPLTVDYQTVIDAISDLSTATVEKGGTDISAAIRSAEFALGKSETNYRALVLLTDGEDLDEDSVAAAKEAGNQSIRIFTVGIGTKEGGTIPLDANEEQSLRDRNHQIVRSHLDEARLEQIASETGGFYVHLDSNASSRLIRDGLERLDKSNNDERSTRIPIERYRWPLTLGLLLLFGSAILNDRKKTTTKSGSLALNIVPALLLAFSGSLRAENAAGLYSKGDFDGALQSFQEKLKNDPDSAELNLGAGNSYYRLQKYDEAFESYSKAMMSPDRILRENAYYDAGNSLFLKGNETKEIEHQLTRYYDARYQYHQALDLNPQDDQAKKNLRLLEQRIKEAEQKREEKQKRSRRSKGGRKRGQKDNGKQGSKSDQPGQPGQEGQSDDPSEDGDDSGSGAPDENDSDSAVPEPTPKKEGQLQENGAPEPDAKSEDKAAPQNDGKMSADEALGLLDSLRDEGQRLDLSRKKTDRGVLRDW